MKRSETTTAFPIVGIGASAGGLEAFTELFRNLPSDTGMAFVLVQHLDPTHKSMLTEIMGRVTRMPTVEVRNRMSVSPNNVYIIPPNKNMSLSGGKFYLVPRTEKKGRHLPVDCFFSSLAKQSGNQAIGVILSGAATDGVLGQKAIKLAGGVTFSQEPGSAKYDSMPKSVIASGSIDYILEPKGIAAKLVKLCRHIPLEASNTEAVEKLLLRGKDDLSRVFVLLKYYAGVDFTLYKKATVKRRIQRRMALTKKRTLKEYVKYLRSDPKEVGALFQDMLISVTNFFRDPKLFRILEKKIFPAILRKKKSDQSVRIWVPACSTGEEAYSLAICLLESLAGKVSTGPVQVFATDVNAVSIEMARKGLYPESIKADVPMHILRRYFVKEAAGYRIVKKVRDICIFAVHDLTRDPPFYKMDLISCRNMLIYMDQVLQKKVVSLLHYGLLPSGFLILGSAESVFSFSDLFNVADKKLKIFVRNGGAVNKVLHFDKREALIGKTKADKERTLKLQKWSIPSNTQDENTQAKDEELRSALEEIQSANEELQSSNEELETSKEELQATKEELETLNDELASRNSELAKTTGDMMNLFNSARMPVIMVSRDLSIHRFTPMAQKMWHLIPSDVGRNLMDINPNITILHLEETLLDAIEHLKTTEQEVQDKNGHWHSMSVGPYKTIDNTIDGAVIVLTDIHATKVAQERIGIAKEYFENIVKAVPDPLIVLDKNLRVQTANMAFFKQFKVTPQQTHGRLIYELGDYQWDIPVLRKILTEVLSKDKPVEEFEVSHKFPHIGERTVVLNARIIAENASGERMILLGIKDITEFRQAENVLKKAREDAEVASKSKSEFLNNIAHDFRTPMHAIMGFSALLREEQVTEKQKKWADIINEQGASLLDLVEDLLDVSRLEAGKPVLRSTEFDLKTCVRSVVETSEMGLSGKDIRMAWSVVDGLPRLIGDCSRLGQILMNLIGNAIKYTDKGDITVKVERLFEGCSDAQCRMKFSIKDTGLGISKDKQQDMFEAFTQFHVFTGGKERGGVGLGLYITKTLIDLMGGTILVESEVGVGSVFVVTLDFAIAG